MAAVASNHRSEGPGGGVEPEQFAESGPSFTAVNGAATTPPAKSKAAPDPPKEAGDEASARPARPSSQQERRKSPSPSRQLLASSHPEREPSPTANQTVDRRGQTPHHQENPEEPKNYYGSHPVTPASQQSNTANGNKKRKRSFPEVYENPNNSAYHTHEMPPSSERQRMYSTDNGRQPEMISPVESYPRPEGYGRPDMGGPPDPYARPEHVGHTDPYARPEHIHPSDPYPRSERVHQPELYPRPDRHQLVRNEYDPRGDPTLAPQRDQPYYSEARMAQALQNYDSMPTRENYVSPEDEDEHGQPYVDYGANRNSQSAMELDRKRRKRVFSNRTKTGCMTCRRRKKKCDEQHPECNNCLRGGFVCEGYTMRNTWQKPSNTKAPIPLQSKNGYPPPMNRGLYQGQYAQETSPEYPGPPPIRNHHMGPDGDRGKPIVVDEERESMYAQPSPPNGHPKPGWTKAARPYPSNPPHISKYQPETDHRPSSMHEMAYDQVADPNSMHPPPPVHRTNSSQSQYSAQSSHPSNPNHSNPQVVAQTALSHPASLRPSPHRRQDLTEREKMLKGNYYLPFSPALTEDREQCMAAIWRFNNATNPSHGASPQERARLFKAIMSMRPTPEPAPPSGGESPAPPMPLPFGSVGERVVVEAPFHCDYGYNITIGDDVLIGADCRISDTCAVTIGARCIFSPNVKLVCATYPIDPRRRMGSGGQALGRNIVIEEDCWIGSNVTILAGVRVGKSSTVGAGSLLHQDVPRFTVVAGNPAKVSRGIYDGNADGQ